MAANPRTSGKKKKNGIVKLKIVVQKLQKSLLFSKKPSSYSEKSCEEAVSVDATCVPADVKEGHFAVIAVDGDEPRRFVVPLSCLTHPVFLSLLEQAAEEYGFDQEGALTVPCQPSELERILAEQWQEAAVSGSDVGVNWGSCKTMLQVV
ncbi:Auxin-induced protein 10A5 [Morella rubra]|uniref:Auxin-induced protein 10A5 n=1 Tax=Morella rubra TaxID=262757 RepID=A0A6A1WWV8_9ROSI|nr:Auxin-induced protein 10A5 [Morella rubra]